MTVNLPASSTPSVPAVRAAMVLPGDTEAISLLGVVNSALRHRTSIAAIAFVFALFAIATGLAKHPTFSSSFSFIPQGRQTTGLSGLAAQLGVQALAAGGDISRSPAFYADLIDARQIIDVVARATYAFPSDTGTYTGTLIDVFGGQTGTAARRRELTITELRKRISASVVQRTGVVEVGVTTDWPVLSRQVATRVLQELTRFNLESRQSQAAAERRFTEQRMLLARDSLRVAENALQGFLTGNRGDFHNSPSLTFEQERLARDVAFRQQLYTGLAQALDQARIDEVRDTPVFTVIDAPEVPEIRNPRGIVTKTLLAVFVGILVGFVIAFVRDQAGSLQSREVDTYVEFDRLRRAALSDLLHPWRPIVRGIERRPRSHR